MNTANWAAAGLMGIMLAAGGQDRIPQSPEPVREQEADQQGAAAGEAPPAPDQSSRTAADPDGTSGSSGAGSPARGRSAAQEHLDRIDQIVSAAIASGKAETLTIERSKLEEIRMHLRQVRTALVEPSRAKPQ